MNRCPVCKKLPVFTCRCFRRDSRCEAGHEWHLCPQHYEVVLGPANHQSGECTCKKRRGNRLATQYKPKLVEEAASRNAAVFMMITSWLSFIASLWLAMFLSNDFFFLGIFWFILTIALVGSLGASRKQ